MENSCPFVSICVALVATYDSLFATYDSLFATYDSLVATYYSKHGTYHDCDSNVSICCTINPKLS